MTTNLKVCSQCKAQIAPDAPAGLCPKCLVRQGLTADPASCTSAPPKTKAELVDTQTINPAIGKKIRYFGDYELLEEIARGGMGIVYKARQQSLKRVVALKMIRSANLATEAEVQRFHIEAEAAANLQHPNIVAIHEVGLHEGQHYFTMDYIDGKNLAQMADGKPLPPLTAANYVKTIAEAVHFAHQRGILHRDLKPQNIMIDNADRPRITDFGLAKQTRDDMSLTQTGVMMGSPGYMPPELAQGRRTLVGPPSDVYSLGAILYELLTGRPPFQGETPLATIRQVVEEDPVSPHKINPNVARDLETICLKCLAKQPEQRYATARMMAEEMGRFINNEPILAQPPGIARKTLCWIRKHPWSITAAASFLIMGLVMLIFGLWEQVHYQKWLLTHAAGNIINLTPMSIKLIKLLNNMLFNIGLIWLATVPLMFYLKLSRRHTWKQQWMALYWKPEPIYPIPYYGRIFVIMLGSFLIMAALFLIYLNIYFFIWENNLPISLRLQLLVIYFMLYFNISLIRRVIREQFFNYTFQPVEQLPSDQYQRICDAIFSGKMRSARKIYCDLTGCYSTEAFGEIDRIFKILHSTHPEKFNLKSLPMSLAVQRKRLLILFLILGIVLSLIVLAPVIISHL